MPSLQLILTRRTQHQLILKDLMLISIILTLTSATDTLLPFHVGRANYAALLERLNQIDPTLGPLLHDGDGPKPFTCSGILNGRAARDGMPIRQGLPYYLRMTGLTVAVSQALEDSLLTTRPPHWTLADHRFEITDAICDAQTHPWTGRTTYEALAAAQLLQSEQLPRQVTLDFASPTSFKSGGINIPVPMPGLVFGSLVERWNTFSPITLSGEMRRFGEEMVAISRYQLESRMLEQKNKAMRIGGVGQVTYTAVGGDRYWLGVLNMLANFALYSGVGVQTTTGMGQVRHLT